MELVKLFPSISEPPLAFRCLLFMIFSTFDTAGDIEFLLKNSSSSAAGDFVRSKGVVASFFLFPGWTRLPFPRSGNSSFPFAPEFSFSSDLSFGEEVFVLACAREDIIGFVSDVAPPPPNTAATPDVQTPHVEHSPAPVADPTPEPELHQPTPAVGSEQVHGPHSPLRRSVRVRKPNQFYGSDVYDLSRH